MALNIHHSCLAGGRILDFLKALKNSLLHQSSFRVLGSSVITLSNVWRNTTRVTSHTYMKTLHIIQKTCIYCCLGSQEMQLYNNLWLCNLTCALTLCWSRPYYEHSWSHVSEIHSRFLLKKKVKNFDYELELSDSSLSGIFQCHLSLPHNSSKLLFWSAATKLRRPMKALSQFGVWVWHQFCNRSSVS